MTEKAANERGGFTLSDAHHNNAIASMAQARQIETCIAGKECDVPAAAQEDDDLVVLHPFAADIDSNLPRCYARGFQQQPLAVENVLI